MKKLFSVGSGIKTLSHFTKEFETCAKQCDIVFYLNNDPVTKEWYQKYAKKSYDLDAIYQSEGNRNNIYHAIADHIVSQFKHYDNICFALYGHPFFCAQPALHAINKLTKDNPDIEIQSFPAVSALDCLFNDLRVNPAERGLQMYEASHMIYEEIPLIPTVDLVILQAGFIDINTRYTGKEVSNIEKLRAYLLKFYDESQKIIIYEAAQFPSQEPMIVNSTIGAFTIDDINTLSTIYTPS